MQIRLPMHPSWSTNLCQISQAASVPEAPVMTPIGVDFSSLSQPERMCPRHLQLWLMPKLRNQRVGSLGKLPCHTDS